MSAFLVPYTFFSHQIAEQKQDLAAAFERVLESGRYILGPECAAFEREFAEYCGVQSAVGVGNGTDALYLTLRTLGIGSGDEVITAANSFVATAATIVHVGARPVFVDIGADLNLDPDQIESAVTARTRAVVPVHMAGRPCRMTEIAEIAARRELLVLEDAAQAVGARLGGKRVGGFGRVACFSLHPLKNLHAFGDGGMVTTADPELAQGLAKLRNHGLKTRDRCDSWGFNSRLDELQAALLRVQMRELDRWTEERRRLASRYHRLLGRLVDVPEEGPDEYCAYQTYVVQAERRDELQQYLVQNGVEALVHYPVPIHLQPAARELGYTREDLPRTVDACRRILSLPLYPGLTESQQDLVADLIQRFFRS